MTREQQRWHVRIWLIITPLVWIGLALALWARYRVD